MSVNPGEQASRSFSDHIHHLLYYYGRQIGGQIQEEVTAKGQVEETFHFECSYPACAYTVAVRVASPVLSDGMVRLLIDPSMLQKRTDEAIAADPERLEGMARPQPITVLMNLRTYIGNALRNSQQSKSIQANNKRFMLSFGVDGKPCQELFEYLGFTFKVSTCACAPQECDVDPDLRMTVGSLPVLTHGRKIPTKTRKKSFLTMC